MDNKKGYWIYDTEEILDTEMDLYAKKMRRNGIEPSKESLTESLDELMKNYFDGEAQALEEDHGDMEKIMKRFELAVEDPDDGNIWICVKLFNVNRLQKILGTENES